MLDDTVTKGVDKLGRLIIPIAFRDALNIRRGDALKMSMPKEGELRISRVYNVKGNNEVIARDIRALRELLGIDVAVCDTECVVASAQYRNNGIIGTELTAGMKTMVREGRRLYHEDGNDYFYYPFAGSDVPALLVEPIRHKDGGIGAVIVLSDNGQPQPVTQEQVWLVRYAARLLYRLL